MTEGTIRYEKGLYALEVGQDTLWIIAAYKSGRLSRHDDSVWDYLSKLERETQRREYKPKIREVLLASINPDYRGLEQGSTSLQGFRIMSADQSRGEIKLTLEQISDDEAQRMGQRINLKQRSHWL